MKHELSPELLHYAQLVTDGPHGLLSTNDLARINEHIADALTGLDELEGTTSLVDVGTGGGLPGLPLAISMPNARIHLVESLGWKTKFLAECVTALHLGDRVTVHTARAEEIVDVIGRETLDAAVARAVAAPAVIAEYLAPFVRVGGKVLAWSTAASALEAQQLGAIKPLGLAAPVVVSAVSPLRAEGVLIAWSKVSATQARFPRRTGVAKKQPLT